MGKEVSQNFPKLEWERQAFIHLSVIRCRLPTILGKDYDLGRSGSFRWKDPPKVTAVEDASNTSKSWIMRFSFLKKYLGSASHHHVHHRLPLDTNVESKIMVLTKPLHARLHLGVGFSEKPPSDS